MLSLSCIELDLQLPHHKLHSRRHKEKYRHLTKNDTIQSLHHDSGFYFLWIFLPYILQLSLFTHPAILKCALLFLPYFPINSQAYDITHHAIIKSLQQVCHSNHGLIPNRKLWLCFQLAPNQQQIPL